jgi:hypothetical protein
MSPPSPLFTSWSMLIETGCLRIYSVLHCLAFYVEFLRHPFITHHPRPNQLLFSMHDVHTSRPFSLVQLQTTNRPSPSAEPPSTPPFYPSRPSFHTSLPLYFSHSVTHSHLYLDHNYNSKPFSPLIRPPLLSAPNSRTWLFTWNESTSGRNCHVAFSDARTSICFDVMYCTPDSRPGWVRMTGWRCRDVLR